MTFTSPGSRKSETLEIYDSAFSIYVRRQQTIKSRDILIPPQMSSTVPGLMRRPQHMSNKLTYGKEALVLKTKDEEQHQNTPGIY